jgi:hypothetical protein
VVIGSLSSRNGIDATAISGRTFRRCRTKHRNQIPVWVKALAVPSEAAHKTGRAKADFEIRQINDRSATNHPKTPGKFIPLEERLIEPNQYEINESKVGNKAETDFSDPVCFQHYWQQIASPGSLDLCAHQKHKCHIVIERF